MCRTRDDAKTWIYAYLLGAGIPKLSSILGCSINEGKRALGSLLATYKSIAKLKDEDIPRDARKGYFIGLDGRYVVCNSEHLMLAGYLQNGEALVEKYSIIEWHRRLKKDGINFRLVNFCHDEVQTIVYGSYEEAEHVGKIQRDCITWAGEQLGVRCPLSGATHIGKSWAETH